MALVLFCLMQDSRRARLFERRSQYAQRRFNSMLYLFDGYCDPNHNFSFLRSDQLQLIALKESVAQLDQCEELGGAGGEARSRRGMGKAAASDLGSVSSYPVESPATARSAVFANKRRTRVEPLEYISSHRQVELRSVQPGGNAMMQLAG
jgi:hypothetical protein